ncbi:MAG: hypothetical protein BWX85_01418 [Chloroflexi bacterium ADurb.Bin120]|nr:MAG: hypothetical protein BWX85_01418 [Chloroflexi bacterium ADurb.Bin120]
MGRHGGLPLHRVGQTRRSAPTLGWADTEIRPNIGLGRHGGLPLNRVGQTRLDTLARHRECCAKVCPYIGLGRHGSIPLQGTGSAARRSAPKSGWADTEVCPYIGLGRHGDPSQHRAGQTWRSAPTLGCADTEVCPYIGLTFSQFPGAVQVFNPPCAGWRCFRRQIASQSGARRAAPGPCCWQNTQN